ncbi:MAG: alpha/beta hydrolase family protein [Pseudohaliea sp.]
MKTLPVMLSRGGGRALLPCLLVTLLLSPLARGGVSFEAVQALPSTPPAARLAYGQADSQYGLYWAPADGAVAAPLVVLIHGGCWLAEYGVDHLRPLAGALAEAGFAVWAPEYRRVGDGGGDPATLEDLRAAIARLPALPVEPRGLAFVGHSAGGHLALWAAAGGSGVVPVPDLAVGLAAITDLAAYGATGGSCGAAVAAFMDGAPAARYRALSPAFLRYTMPVVLLHGDADAIVPPAQAAALPGATVHALPGAGHFDLIHPGGEAFRRLLAVLREGLAS